ncbi:MAG: outer membrane beta-barrel protein [Planctomycetota bacterium]
MRWSFSLTLFTLAAYSAPIQDFRPVPQQTRTRRSINVFVGERELDDSAWKPVEDQESIGVDVEFESPGGVGWEAGVFASDDSSGSFDGSHLELFGGLHKSFAGTYARVRPYVAGGLSVIDSEFEGPGFSEDDLSIGVYLRAGVSIWITDMVSFGLDWRRLFGTRADLRDIDDVDYEQFSLVLGFAF